MNREELFELWFAVYRAALTGVASASSPVDWDVRSATRAADAAALIADAAYQAVVREHNRRSEASAKD